MRSYARILIDRSAEAVFDLSQDYALRRRWDTLTPTACLVQAAPQAMPGAIVRCPTAYGFHLDVVYVGWHRPLVAAFRMVRGPWWLQAAAGTWRFVPLGAQRCRAEFIYNVRLHPLLARWSGWLVQAMISRQSYRRLTALKRLAEAAKPFF